MQKRAVLDLGTNTFHLLIAEISESTINFLYQETIAVKLGEGGINQGIITDEAFERGMNAIDRFAERINRYKVNEIRAAGTAALRSAVNGAAFIEEVKRRTGIAVKLIDGGLEAELIYEGVKQAVKLGKEPVLIMDIGGGSTEFILADENAVFWKKSYPLGAAKLMDKFHKHDPISEEEVGTIHQHLDEHLTELKQICHRYKPQVLIGSAGAFETFAALTVHHFQLAEELLKQPEFSFKMDQFAYISSEIVKSRHKERAANPLIVSVRVDMIVTATVITDYIIKQFNIPQLKLSAYALKEGLMAVKSF